MKALSKIVVILCCALALAPIVWHLSSSFKSGREIAEAPSAVLPAEPTAANYVELFDRRPFASYYWNSFVISTMATLLCLGASSLAAYRLARMPQRTSDRLAGALLAAAFLPPIVFLFPLYEMVRAFGMSNHPWSLIVPYAALNLPFTTWLLRDYFRQIPFELEEAAAIDGMTPLQTFRQIILPLAEPALVTAGILTFIFSWNEFILALTFMNVEGSKTVTVGIATLSGAFADEVPWGLIAAGVVASSAPLILLALIFQKKIAAGLTAGSVK